MDSVVLPKQQIALRLPSGMYKLVAITPNTSVSLGKFGSFQANQIIGRPFHVTYEILNEPSEDGHSLRIVPAAELHAEALITEGSGEADGMLEETDAANGEQQPMRTNRDIVDDGSAQTLTLDEIEELKKNSTGAGEDIIAKLLESHSAIDKKTVFSLAKYKLRKEKKYLKRFTVLPMDVNLLTDYMLERKELNRTMELRHEIIGLIGCWGNVHNSGNSRLENLKPSGRYLVADDTGGLVVAAMAERMGILYPSQSSDAEENGDNSEQDHITSGNTNGTEDNGERQAGSKVSQRIKIQGMAAVENTITVIHPYSQANLVLLKQFGFDIDEPDSSHPLYDHLKTVSWLQLVEPGADNMYSEEPETLSEEKLKTLKPRQRGTYHRKHARWLRVKRVVDEVRTGGYDGLIVASHMDPDSILKHAVPLLTGGASVVVYSPTVEQLTKLMDQYSSNRRAAYINRKTALEKERQNINTEDMDVDLPSIESELSSEFPLDPTLILAPMLQTSRVREWQALPGRTHPLMTGRGNAEGYIFHGTRVIPPSGRIQARGISNRKKRKLDTGTPEDVPTPAAA
ncbi:tRNA (adenine(58)-N(1))-methyltransferase non-catalytic subunit trm6 [Talaromyces atroroseus]|uniref:tRNA (adenine(58)-N(1))-methyltransferase non-catalytic subunit TRM6 n=1 Tax=Talaromyces atroroseus TaxID=1441469 RepID=A0A225ARI8_TALAT|nr:tRNA (adenine(58)-N(1))-methyltransferase non-catalytic subunit trm6 [Talaromyces atroroseus]OKL59888.1 tRNA (adenine(58)-N(1))-methyltransferase non-catalytic subunit trm6 [Talaromyces atroroseus]